MKSIINKQGVETKIFANTFEEEANSQVIELCNNESYLTSKIRIMPDAHAGKGCTVGTTMTISDRVTPNLVGVDIGCGMLTAKISTSILDLKRLDRVINSKIPHGFNVHNTPQILFDFSKLRCKDSVDVTRALSSLGTLGGGNHFIEVSKGSSGDLYITIHSGSRKLGVEVCKYYQTKAETVVILPEVRKQIINKCVSENRTQDIQKELKLVEIKPINKDLSALVGQDFEDYCNDMMIVQSFATMNRIHMLSIIEVNYGFSTSEAFQTIHNYIDFNRKILRKGAVSAELGEMLLIPINMRDGSLLCKGKGNADWNYSAPHGAGRILSRTKAKQVINLQDYKDSMEGIFTTSVNTKTLDEAPMAYKTIEEISTAIIDTVDIVDILKPIYNFKDH